MLGDAEDHGLWLSCLHAPFAPLPLELDQGPSSGSLAQPLSAVAHRDVLRRKDDADRFSGILGVSLAGAHQPLALLKVDGRDGEIRSPKAEEQW